MKLKDYPLLTDEDIDVAVVQFLRTRGFDVLDVAEESLFGALLLPRLRQRRMAKIASFPQ